MRNLTEHDLEDIKKSAEKIIEEFSEIEKDLPSGEETYYLIESINVLKSDKKVKDSKELKDFRKKFLDIMPKKDEEGNLKVEVAEWTE